MIRFHKTPPGFLAISRVFLSVLFAAAVFAACNNPEKGAGSLLPVSDSEPLYKVSIDIDTLVERHTTLSDILKDSKLIKLETSDESILGRVHSLRIFNDKLFVGDSEGVVLVFNMDGKFLFKLGREGKGPGEFMNVVSWYIDKSNDRVVLLDGPLQKLLFFNSEGEFISEESFPSVYSSNVAPAGEGNVIFYNDFNHANKDAPYALLVYDLESKEMVSAAFPIEWVEPGSYVTESPFATGDGAVYFKQCHSYEVYRINTASNTGRMDIRPYFKVDFGERNLPAGFMTREFDERRMNMLKNEIYEQKKYIKSIEYNMTNDYVQYSFSIGGEIFNGIYSKEDRKNLLYNGVKNDIYELPILDIVLLPDDMAYSVVYPDILYRYKEMYAKNDEYKMPAKLKDHLDEIAISDNPLIIIGEIDIN